MNYQLINLKNWRKQVLKRFYCLKVQRGGYTIIRFIANNPGTWLVHCHKDLHSEHGLAFLLKVGSVTDFPVKPNQWPRCGNYFYEKLNTNFQNTNSGIRVSVNDQLLNEILKIFCIFFCVYECNRIKTYF